METIPEESWTKPPSSCFLKPHGSLRWVWYSGGAEDERFSEPPAVVDVLELRSGNARIPGCLLRMKQGIFFIQRVQMIHERARAMMMILKKYEEGKRFKSILIQLETISYIWSPPFLPRRHSSLSPPSRHEWRCFSQSPLDGWLSMWLRDGETCVWNVGETKVKIPKPNFLMSATSLWCSNLRISDEVHIPLTYYKNPRIKPFWMIQIEMFLSFLRQIGITLSLPNINFGASDFEPLPAGAIPATPNPSQTLSLIMNARHSFRTTERWSNNLSLSIKSWTKTTTEGHDSMTPMNHVPWISCFKKWCIFKSIN